jgi:peptide-methionine (S)-S-oxide reductase
MRVLLTSFLVLCLSTMANAQKETEIATLAGGCFWCTEAVFERVEGVVDVYSGYTGGEEENPTYQQVSYGRTTHAEAIQVVYDPAVLSYETILSIFFTAAHDPTQLDRQGNDVGKQYRSAAYYHNADQKKAIDKAIAKYNKEKYNGEIVTEVVPFEKFWMAEGYHQDYYELNPGNPYIINVARDKVRKLNKYFPDLVKAKYRGERL